MTEQSEPEAGNTGCHHGEYKDGGDPDDPRGVEPAHHARRPMNAFLIFCKRHRTVVRDKYPNLENRSITKILGEWWANLEDDEKASYTGLAKKYKDAFFSANPDFKWYKLPAPPLRTLSTRPTNIFSTAPTDYRHVKNENMEIEEEKTNNNSTKIDYNKRLFVGHEDAGNSTAFTPGKLADEAQMGGLSSLMFDNRNVSPETQRNTFLDLSKQISLQCTPNYKVVCNDPPGAPRKRSISETDPENSNKYFKEESIQSQTKVTEPDMEQSMDLQNALSETSRMLEKAFESKGDAINGNRKLEGVGLNKNSDSMNPKTEDQISSNLTQQEIIDRVVNRKLTDFKAEDETPINRNELSRLSWGMDFTKDPKASERSCKGKRYEEFMAFGGLYVNKRQKRDFDSKAYEYYEKNIKTEYSNSPSCSWKNVHSSDRPSGSSASLEYDSDHEDNNKDTSNHESEANSKMFKASDFDLDAKIRALPSLSFEKFHQKKKENKKRKSNIAMKAKDFHPRHSEKPHSTFFPTTKGGIFCSENKVYIPQTTSQLPDKQQYGPKPNSNNGSHQKDRSDQLRSAFIGSKKRKPRKISITRLDVNTSIKTDFLNRDQHYGVLQTEYTTSCNNTLQPLPLVSEPQIDLCALETLAEVASKTSKINENN